jgi:hypothetical protein
MHRSDFVAVLRHPRSTLARIRGKVNAYRRFRRYYRYLRRRFGHDPELLWERLEHWADRQLARIPSPGISEPRDAATEERVGFRAVLCRSARALSEYYWRFPNEPDRRIALLEQDFQNLRGHRTPS